MDDLDLRRPPAPTIAAADLYAALRLRAAVFVVEQDCAYLDPDGRDLDPTTVHLWLGGDDGDAWPPTSGCSPSPTAAHRIGRVVTDPAHRGERAGRRS